MKRYNKIVKNIIGATMTAAVAAAFVFSSSTVSAQTVYARTMPAPKNGTVRPPVLLPMPKATPAPVPIPNEYVKINIKHQIQEAYLCVPTSASMMLSKFGFNYPPRQIKLATLGKPYYGPNTPFNNWNGTSFQALVYGISYLGIYTWRHSVFPNAEFEKGLSEIKSSLRRGYPVMICITTSSSYLHAVVVSGFDEKNKQLIINDPMNPNGSSFLAYDRFKSIWWNRPSTTRSAVFMYQ